jgi:PDZ domain-containing protein
MFRGRLCGPDSHDAFLETTMSRPDDADTTADPEGPPPSVASPASAADTPNDGAGASDRGPDDATEGTPDGTGGASRIDHRRRRRAYIVGSAIGIVVAIVVALAFVRVPYYRFSPGTLYPTEGLITVTGAKTYPSDGGQIDFTTVSSKKATVLEAFLARFDDAVELVDAEKIDGTNPPEETRRINLEMMSDAKTNAEVVALQKLGYPIKVEGSGALVKSVAPGSPAAQVLKANDAIVAIDGSPVHLRDEAVAALGTHQPGDTVTMTIETAPGEPAHDVSATLVSRCTLNAGSTPGGSPSPTDTPTTAGSTPPGSATTGSVAPSDTCSAEDAAKPVLGVTLGTRDTQFKLPFSLAIDTKDVGGPSAGLALTLGIIDVLTPGSLTGGRHVATTGTINLDGSVGPIGGIRQKTYLAVRQNVELFIVPTDEFADASRYAAGTGTRVVAVDTLDQALTALADNGGNTEVIQQAAAANAPGTTAN